MAVNSLWMFTCLVPALVTDQNYECSVIFLDIVSNLYGYSRIKLLAHGGCRCWYIRNEAI